MSDDHSKRLISKLRRNIDLIKSLSRLPEFQTEEGAQLLIDQIDIATSLALVALRIDDAARLQRIDGSFWNAP